jgi:hypothetical protein
VLVNEILTFTLEISIYLMQTREQQQLDDDGGGDGSKFRTRTCSIAYWNSNSNTMWDVARTILFFSHNLEFTFLSYGIQLKWNSFNCLSYYDRIEQALSIDTST